MGEAMKMMTKWSIYPLPGVVWTKRAWRFVHAASEALLHLFRLRSSGGRRRKESASNIHKSRAYWPPSHVLPIQEDIQEGRYQAPDALFYYDSSWNSAFFPTGGDDNVAAAGVEAEAARDRSVVDGEAGEIDRLADVFIASFHEKFRLEEQESYRMFQEMLARGV